MSGIDAVCDVGLRVKRAQGESVAALKVEFALPGDQRGTSRAEQEGSRRRVVLRPAHHLDVRLDVRPFSAQRLWA